MPDGHQLSRYLVASDVFAVGGGVPGRLVHSTRSGATVHLPEVLWQSLRMGQVAELGEDQRRALTEVLVLVPADSDELRDVLADNRQAIDEATALEQVIQPSAACQLDCSYCGQEHRPAHMAEHVQDRLLGRIQRRLAGARERGRPHTALNVGWFGGEPLLGLGAMRRLSPQLRGLAEQYGCDYDARIVTNGLRLNPDIAAELQRDHRVTHVEVTLDGPARTHDRRRPTKAGGPSFAAILDNLHAVAERSELNFRLVVRCNVDRANAASVPELIDLLAGEGLQRRVELYFSPVYAWGNDADEAALAREEYASREVEWLARMIRAGYDVDLLPKRRRIVCLAVRPSARVTDAFGEEFNCTEVPYVPAYGQPNRFAVGHVDGTTRAEPFFRTFNEQIAEGGVGCHWCPMLPACGGACPKSWAEGKAPCPSSKHNLPERLLLHFARGRITAPPA